MGISSVSGIRGLPTQGIYSASKSAVSRYLESLRLEVYNSDIAVTELAPGCIDTDMNRDLEFRPFVTSLKKGARILADKIEAILVMLLRGLGADYANSTYSAQQITGPKKKRNIIGKRTMCKSHGSSSCWPV